MVRRVKSLLITLHLYSGLALCLLFVVWFVSGVAMAYYRTPVLTETQRLAFAPSLETFASSIPPGWVPRLVADWNDKTVLRLGQLQGRPVYRWHTSAEGWRSAWADTGDPVSFKDTLLKGEAERWFGDGRRFRYDGEFYEHSQWSYFAAAREHYPLHRFSTDGPAPRHVFFSSRTGEPVVATSAASWMLYYLGPGLHYFSFYPIRNNDALWRGLVNWSSGIGAGSCLIGLILGLWQLRWRALGNGQSIVPYTRRWLRWHHWTGLLFGLLTFTFVLSGLFSMNPWGMFPTTEVPATIRAAFEGPQPPIQALPSPSELVEALQAGGAPKELEWNDCGGSRMYKP